MTAMNRWWTYLGSAAVGGGAGAILAGLATLGGLVVWIRTFPPVSPAEGENFEFLACGVIMFSTGIGAILGLVGGVLMAWLWPCFSGALPGGFDPQRHEALKIK
jgi:hypothetical protein